MIKKIKQEFEKIKASDLAQKNKNLRYADLMTQLEYFYKIPMLQADLASADIPADVIELYKEISTSRNFTIY